MDKLYLVVPAYNEEDNVEALVRDWYSQVEMVLGGRDDFRMVVINDGSEDSTYDKLCSLKTEFSKLIVLTKFNSGHGSTVLYGYRYAIENGANWIFQTDSDGQTNPVEFNQFWEKRKHYDAILGNREVREDGQGRKFVENVVCFLLWAIFGVKVKDANAPFRLMRADLVNKYIRKLPQDFYVPNIMFVTYFTFFKENILFLPITFKLREKGTSTINPKKIIKIGWRALGDFRKLRREIND